MNVRQRTNSKYDYKVEQLSKDREMGGTLLDWFCWYTGPYPPIALNIMLPGKENGLLRYRIPPQKNIPIGKQFSKALFDFVKLWSYVEYPFCYGFDHCYKEKTN